MIYKTKTSHAHTATIEQGHSTLSVHINIFMDSVRIVSHYYRKKSSLIGLVGPMMIICPLCIQNANAVNETWTGALTTDWGTAGNWNPAVVPGIADTAIFPDGATSYGPSITGANYNIGELSFTANNNSYFVSIDAATLSINGIGGVGISNSGASPMNIPAIGVLDQATLHLNSVNLIAGLGISLNAVPTFTYSTINFNGASDAGSAEIVNSTNSGDVGGITNFSGTASAGSAKIVNVNTSGFGTVGGTTNFIGTSTAGSAQIFNYDYGTTNFNGTIADLATIVNDVNLGTAAGTTNFNGNSTASTATIVNVNTFGSGAFGGTTNFNDSSTAGSAQIGNFDYGITNFNGTSAASAIIENDVNSGIAAGTTNFNGNSTAGTAAILNTNTFGSGAFGGTTNFNDSSTAGNATIVNNDLGTTAFIGTPTADNATIINNAGGVVNISGTTVGIGIGSLSGAGNVNLGSKILTLGGLNQANTISGVLSGLGGSLIKTGTNTLTLTGANTYTGGTTITGGILQGTLPTTAALTVTTPGIYNVDVARTIGSLAGNGSVTLAGPLTTGGNNTSTLFSGVMSGPGGLIKTGTGNFTVTGANTYTGGTTIAGGTLTGNTASLTGNIVDNAALVFDQGFDGSFGGIISGTGTLIKLGTGKLTLTGANTYTGGTTITAGALQGTLPTTTALTVTTPGAYIFDGASTIGSLAGNGSITLTGPLTAGGNNTSTLFSGVLSGPGGLIKTGTGNFTVTGANTYTGGTTIAGGTLTNNGSLVSPVTVSLGATYAGNGTSGPLTNSGVVTPGNSIGTLTVNGNYTQAPTGTFLTEIAPQNVSDLLAVTGTATLDGTLNIVPVGSLSSLRGKTYTILTANGGVSGVFTNIIKPSLLSLNVNYLPGSVVINTSTTPIISTLASTGNSGIIAQYIDQIINAGTASADLDTVILALETIAGSGSAALANALEQISPDPFRELGFIASGQTNMVREAVGLQQQRILDTLALKLISTANPTSKGFVSKFQQLQNDIRTGIAFRPQSGSTRRMARDGLGVTAGNLPLNKTVQCGKTNVWIQSFGGGQDKKNSNALAGTRNRSFGTSSGADFQVLPNTYIGVMGGGMGTHFDWKQNRGHGNVKSYYGGLYGLWLSKENIYVDGQATLGGDRYRSHRKINFATINRTARERHNGLSFSTDLELGYLLTIDASVIQPFLKYAYILGHENSFTEKNAGSLNVHRGSHNSQFGRGELGSIFSQFFVCDETLVYPSVKLSWVQKRSFQGKNVKFNFADQSFGTTVHGDNRIRNLFDAGVSLTAQFKDGVYMTGNVEGEIGSGEKSGTLQLAVGYQF